MPRGRAEEEEVLGVSLSRRCPHVGGACLSTPEPMQLAPLCSAWGRSADTLAVAGGKRVVAPGPQRLALRAATCAFSMFILTFLPFTASSQESLGSVGFGDRAGHVQTGRDCGVRERLSATSTHDQCKGERMHPLWGQLSMWVSNPKDVHIF